MAAFWDGELTRTWQFETPDGVSHVVHLYHDTITGVRSAMLDFDEIPRSLGTSSVFLDPKGHRISFTVPPDNTPAYIEILKHGFVGFKYTCFVGGKQIPETTQVLAANQDESDLEVKITETCLSNDGTGTDHMITWYTLKAKRKSDGFTTTVHRRFRDFAELHAQVRASFKGHHLKSSLPDLPEKHFKFVVDHNHSRFVGERKRQLQRYLDTLLQVPHVSSMTAARAFVGLMGHVREVSMLFHSPTLGLSLIPSHRPDTPAVVGFVQNTELCPHLMAGDVVSKINGNPVATLTFQGVVQKIKTHPRPLVLHFVQYTDARINDDVAIQERKDGADDDEEENDENMAANVEKEAQSSTAGDNSVPGEDNTSQDSDEEESKTSSSSPQRAPVAPDSPIGEGTEDTFI